MMTAVSPAFEDGDGNKNRDHPNLRALNALHLTYPGFERDKREAEAVHFGTSKLSLGFDAAIRRLKVKQRAHEEQKSMQAIHRSHPNLVSLDALKLTYPGWQEDFQKAEDAHNRNPNCDFMEILRKIQVRQLRFENDRSHYRLIEIDNLKLSYPGWKADIRNLEKFHFEEAFFLPGDSLFQSKLDGLKRRQHIYLRSQKVRANRTGIGRQVLGGEDPEEDIITVNPPAKKSYAVLTTEPKPQHERFHLIQRATALQDEEDRMDRQPTTRAPYAVILDADSMGESMRTPIDPPNRPDPPENKDRVGEHPKARKSVDCDDSTLDNNIRGGIDCDEQVIDEEEQETKSDPQGYIGDEHVNQSAPVSSWPSKLSSYIDLGPIMEPEESDEGGTSEDIEEIAELLPPTRKYRTPTTVNSRRSGRSIRPKGIYSAPPMPICEDDNSRRSLSSRATSALTSSSSRAVFAGDESAASQSSTRAVWSSGGSVNSAKGTVASATSSRAVWAESPNPYSFQTPSSMRAVLSIPDSLHEKDHRQRLRNRGNLNSNDRIRRTRRSTEDRTRRVAEHKSRRAGGEDSLMTRRGPLDDTSRVSKGTSKASMSSHGSSRTKRLGRCTICGDPDKNHVFVPCGHLCACKQCAEQVISRKMTCPVCRGEVTEAIQVFL